MKYDVTIRLQGVIESIKGNTKLIFIVTPESKDYLKKMAEKKTPGCSLLIMAMEQKVSTECVCVYVQIIYCIILQLFIKLLPRLQFFSHVAI